MIYRLLITLKSSGKDIEILVESTGDADGFEFNQQMSDTEWLIIKGFNAHPLKVRKVIGIRWREIAGVEMIQADDWLAESAKDFNKSLEDESEQ